MTKIFVIFVGKWEYALVKFPILQQAFARCVLVKVAPLTALAPLHRPCLWLCVHKTSNAFQWDHLISLLLGLWTSEPIGQRSHTPFHMYEQTEKQRKVAGVKERGAIGAWSIYTDYWERNDPHGGANDFLSHSMRASPPPTDWQVGLPLASFESSLEQRELDFICPCCCCATDVNIQRAFSPDQM